MILERTFEETEGYDESIVLRGIGFESHCETICTIIGKAWSHTRRVGRSSEITSLPCGRCRIERLQIQEKMTG